MRRSISITRLAIVAQAMISTVWTSGIVFLVFFMPDVDIDPEKHRSQGLGFVDVVSLLAIALTPAIATWFLYRKRPSAWWISVVFDGLGLSGASWLILNDFNGLAFELSDNLRFHGLLACLFLVPLVLLVIGQIHGSSKASDETAPLQSQT